MDIDGKASLWVEKYWPQSLDVVAAHCDIVDTNTMLGSSPPATATT